MQEKERKELINWMKFTQIRGIGSSKMLKLIGFFGSFENIYSATYEELFKTRIFNELMIEELKSIKTSFDEDYLNFIINICEKEGIKIIPFFSKDYPIKLKNLPDAPLTLYVQGDLKLFSAKKVAIVGSRESDNKAKKWAYDIAKDLSRNGIVIVSGGAKGIDIQGHQAALDIGAKTICVLGSGLLKLYPAEHREIFDKIKLNGLLISENPPDRKVEQLALVRRNRIISGISSGVILASSSSKGGSKTQMKIAYNQRIPIYCPKLSLNLLPNEGLIEGIKEYGLKEIDSIEPILSEIKREDKFFTKQQTL